MQFCDDVPQIARTTGKECKHINCPGIWHVQNLAVKGLTIYISPAGGPFYHASIMLLLVISAFLSCINNAFARYISLFIMHQ